jgi:hypothetical protein
MPDTHAAAPAATASAVPAATAAAPADAGPLLDLDRLAATPLVSDPCDHLVAEGLLSAAALAAVGRDFPAIARPGLFPAEAVQGGPAFDRLIAEIRGPRLAAVLSATFGLDLGSLPLMVTVRGHCAAKDGRIHTDSVSKVLTCLLYLNRADWPAEGGRLRLLRRPDSLDDPIAEVPPTGGTLVAFRRTDISWHGHAPFAGPRRYVMFNWLASETAAAREIARHTLSARLKSVLGFGAKGA